MSQLLAFDLSTTVCGWSIFEINTQKIIHCTYYKFKDGAELLDKADELKKLLLDIRAQFPLISSFVIEERLKSFRAGGTNAESMLKLAQFNFLCQYFTKAIHNWEIKEINVNTARKICFPAFHSLARKNKTQKQKEVAFDMALQVFAGVVFPMKVMKSGKRKGEEVYLDEAGDMADSLILGLSCLKMSYPLNEL